MLARDASRRRRSTRRPTPARRRRPPTPALLRLAAHGRVGRRRPPRATTSHHVLSAPSTERGACVGRRGGAAAARRRLRLAWAALESPLAGVEIALAAAVGGALVLPALAALAVGRRIGLCRRLRGRRLHRASQPGPWRALAELVDGLRDASSGERAVRSRGPARAARRVVVVGVLPARCGASPAPSRRERPLAAGGAAAVGIAWPATLVAQRRRRLGLRRARRSALADDALRASGATAACSSRAWPPRPSCSPARPSRRSVGSTPDRSARRLARLEPARRRSRPCRRPVRLGRELRRDRLPGPSRPWSSASGRRERALYWRASTLDTFAGDRWIENLYPVLIGRPADRVLPADPLLPRAARRSVGLGAPGGRRSTALDDDRLVAASQPMRIALRRVRARVLPQRRRDARAAGIA